MSVTYVLDENRNIQTVEPKLAYYTSLTCFEAALPDIEVGSLVAMPEEDSGSSTSSGSTSAAPPIGFVYIRFPGMDDPNTLFPGTTWENISSNFAGAFFRAEGGNASTFGSGLQTCATAVNGLQGGNTGRGGNHTHNASVPNGPLVSCYRINGCLGCSGPAAGPNTITYYLHTSTYTCSHSHSVSLLGDVETRPVNTTIQLYRRKN